MVKTRILLLAPLLVGAVSLQAVGEKCGKEEEAKYELSMLEELPNELKNHIASFLEPYLEKNFERSVTEQWGTRIKGIVGNPLQSYVFLWNGSEIEFISSTRDAALFIDKINITVIPHQLKAHSYEITIPNGLFIDKNNQPMYWIQSEDKKWCAIVFRDLTDDPNSVIVFHTHADGIQKVTVHLVSDIFENKDDVHNPEQKSWPLMALYFDKKRVMLGVLAYTNPSPSYPIFESKDQYEFRTILLQEDPKEDPKNFPFTLQEYFRKSGLPVCKSLTTIPSLDKK